MEKTFVIYAGALDQVKTNIDKVNKRIEKMPGFDPIKVEIIDAFYKTFGEDSASYAKYKMLEIKVTGQIPFFDGWEFIAMLDFDRVTKTVFVHGLNDKTIPAKYLKKTSISCQHCGHKRYRTKSFVIYNAKENRHMEVGSTCLKKFFKTDISKLIPFINAMEGIQEPDNFGFGNGSASFYVDTLELIIAAKYQIDRHGYMSKSKAYFHNQTCYNLQDRVKSTYERTFDLLGSHELLKIKNADIRHAKNAIEYFAGLDVTDNDYLINLHQIAGAGMVSTDKAGYAVSMVVAYDRAMQKKADLEKAKTKPSNHIGQVGERLKKIPVKIILTRNIETQFGDSKLYKMADNDGNVYTSFYSGYKFDFDKGENVILTGTVKKHDEYNDVKQTVLNRIILAQ